MKIRTLIVFAFAILAFLSGCYNPINAHTARKYYELAVKAEDRGDFSLAREYYSRAYINSKYGHLGSEPEAHCLYEWSRVTGYLGMYADAEGGFNEVLNLIDKSGGKTDNLRPPALGELSRLLHDTSQHEKAIFVYEKAIAEYDKRGVSSLDPLVFTIFLDDYATSLKAAGYATRAEDIAARSRAIKVANKDTTAGQILPRYKITTMNVESTGISEQDANMSRRRGDWNGSRLVYARLINDGF